MGLHGLCVVVTVYGVAVVVILVVVTWTVCLRFGRLRCRIG